MAVCYPNGIDLGLRRLLDTLRQYQIEVRVEVINRFDGSAAPVVYDGHLRRVGNNSEGLLGGLGFFADATHADPKYALADADYDRLLTITVIDKLVIGRSTPRLIWQTSEERLGQYVYHCDQKVRRERRKAVWFVIHVFVVIAVNFGAGVAFTVSAFADGGPRSVVWGVTLAIAVIALGSTLGCWEKLPELSVLLRHGGISSVEAQGLPESD